MDYSMVDALIALGSFLSLVCGGIITWLLFNERRLSSLEKGQETTDETVKEGIKRLDGRLEALQKQLTDYFTRT